MADARGHRVIRVRDGGEVLDTVTLTADRHAYACMLGGADGRNLFVCTSTGSGPAMGEKRDGGIDVIAVDSPAAGLP